MQVPWIFVCVLLFNIYSFMSHFCNSFWVPALDESHILLSVFISQHTESLIKIESMIFFPFCNQRKPNSKALPEWAFTSQIITYLPYSVPVLFSSKHYDWASPVITNFVEGGTFCTGRLQCLCKLPRSLADPFLETGTLPVIISPKSARLSDLCIIKTKCLYWILTCHELDSAK